MNYLALVQKTWIKCGLTGTPPSAITSQIDMAQRVVAYVADAYRFVQLRHPTWAFMWRSVEGVLAQGQTLYFAADFNAADFKTLRRMLIQQNSKWEPIEVVTDTETTEFDNLSSGTPTKVAVTKSGMLLLNHIPTEVLPVKLEYYRSVHELVNATDTPLIPEDFQHVIVFKAMEYYAHFDSDTALLQEAQREYLQLMGRLEVDQLEKMKFAAPRLIVDGGC